MGLQLIFVVETNKKCNSDWIYIKDTIEHFYQYERTQVKLSVVYMDGKGKYKQKEKQVNWFICYKLLKPSTTTDIKVERKEKYIVDDYLDGQLQCAR